MVLNFLDKNKLKKEVYNIIVDFVNNYVLSTALKNLNYENL